MLPVRFGLFLFAVSLGIGAAQQVPPQPLAPAPSLDEILKALDANNHEYVHGLPNFFCDEKVISTILPDGPQSPESKTRVESTFRIRRKPPVNGRFTLEETRDTRSVDGKPVVSGKDGDTLVGPARVTGVFSNALFIVSDQQRACFDYKVLPPRPKDDPKLIAIAFSSRMMKKPDPMCNPHPSSGRAFINRDTLRLVRLEKRSPEYEARPDYTVSWTWEADFAPADLGGSTFWLPRHIHSEIDANGSNTYWLFDAEFSDFHRMSVSSRILPGSEMPPENEQPHP